MINGNLKCPECGNDEGIRVEAARATLCVDSDGNAESASP